MATWKRDAASGLVVLVPIIVTLYVVLWLYGAIVGYAGPGANRTPWNGAAVPPGLDAGGDGEDQSSIPSSIAFRTASQTSSGGASPSIRTNSSVPS